jgi:hypothetical protein
MLSVGIGPEKIGVQIASLSQHLGWDLTRGGQVACLTRLSFGLPMPHVGEAVSGKGQRREGFSGRKIRGKRP